MLITIGVAFSLVDRIIVLEAGSVAADGPRDQVWPRSRQGGSVQVPLKR